MFDPPRFRIEPEKAQKLAERALQGLHRTHSWLHPMRIKFLNELIDVPGSEEVDMSFHGNMGNWNRATQHRVLQLSLGVSMRTTSSV